MLISKQIALARSDAMAVIYLPAQATKVIALASGSGLTKLVEDFLQRLVQRRGRERFDRMKRAEHGI